MSDVEIITELNHRAARERELGERWDEIVRLRKRQKSLMKIAETACFSVACMLLGTPSRTQYRGMCLAFPSQT